MPDNIFNKALAAANGGGGGTTDNTTQDRIPYKDNGAFENSPLRFDSVNNKIISDVTIEVPGGTIDLSDTVAISEATLSPIYTESTTQEVSFGVRGRFTNDGSTQPIIPFTKTQQTVIAQSDFSQTITVNPLIIPTLATVDVQTNSFKLKVASPMVNVRLSLVDTESGIIQKYIPTKSVVEDGVGGLNFPVGDVTIDFLSDDMDTINKFNLGITPLQSLGGRPGTILIEADNIALLGNSSNIPYVENELQFLVTKDVAYVDDTSAIQSNYVQIGSEQDNTTTNNKGVVMAYNNTGVSDTVTNNQFTAGFDSIANPTIITDGSNTFMQNDIIEISSNILNKGLFEVESHIGNILTLRGVGLINTVEDFTLKNIEIEVNSAVINKVDVAVIRNNLNGSFEQGKGSETPIVYSKLISEDDEDICRIGWGAYFNGDLTPINIPSNTPTQLTLDTSSGFETEQYLPLGASGLWNSTTGQFDFSSLDIGDMVDIRVDGSLTNSGINQSFEFYLTASIGTASEFSLPFDAANRFFPATAILSRYNGLFIGSTDMRDNPAELRVESTSNGSAFLVDIYIKVLKRLG